MLFPDADKEKKAISIHALQKWPSGLSFTHFDIAAFLAVFQ